MSSPGLVSWAHTTQPSAPFCCAVARAWPPLSDGGADFSTSLHLCAAAGRGGPMVRWRLCEEGVRNGHVTLVHTSRWSDCTGPVRKYSLTGNPKTHSSDKWWFHCHGGQENKSGETKMGFVTHFRRYLTFAKSKSLVFKPDNMVLDSKLNEIIKKYNRCPCEHVHMGMSLKAGVG